MPEDNKRPQPPAEIDGKEIIATTPGTVGWKTWFTGEADAAGQRGGGVTIVVDFDAGPDTKEIKFNFSEPVELHDGEPQWEPVDAWGLSDNFTLSVEIKANAPSSTPGTGNVNEYDLGGGKILYTVADGDGSHTLALATAHPTPSENSTGQFDCDAKTGVITASAAPGTAKFNLFSFATTFYFIKALPLGGNTGVTQLDVYRAEWIHQRWEFTLSCTKSTAGNGKLGAWLLLFRPGNTATI